MNLRVVLSDAAGGFVDVITKQLQQPDQANVGVTAARSPGSEKEPLAQGQEPGRAGCQARGRRGAEDDQEEHRHPLRDNGRWACRVVVAQKWIRGQLGVDKEERAGAPIHAARRS
jgi:hypothetical protein